ncbi:MAG: DUF3098 domain-containing protein [Mucilaginibacter sp.]|jgi:hypothetical protein|uniref:DUF3098 domain-containing protein n=1 Tax=Mucilaginibacter sp. L3T2-6 TaxID=3062491 RepID=UPI002676051C|nr:DUF3098 domain-containing protein [Mucilaginibacter sp. L3T2-6]MDO3643912.1 DUF3098 domain-containing protein [Mucilaginibacter sp. L3T2-6]MDV6216365.1 DUF3098 domain-containing protein [Mucilaginibacter sp. L3T2-6]
MAQQNKPGTPIKTTSAARPAAKPTDARPTTFVFGKENYRLFIIAIAVVAFGFILMSGNTDIYSTTKIVIAPLVVLGGFAIGFFAIFKKAVKVD